MQAAQLANTPSHLGRYTLRQRIAVGGMAEVFEARDTQRDERVVVKLLLPHLCSDAEVLQMFADEARLTTQLTHDNLVRTRDTGQLRGRPYLVMELVDGCTLDALLKRAGALSPEMAARITLDVLEALDYLHGYCDEAGQWLHIVHRDVNPRNVLLSHDGEVKLADFGIARSRVRAARTRSGVIKGTVQYMSPEQITGSDLDHRADLYGVGLLLFEMLTGRPYIEGAQEIDLLRVAENPCWRAPSKVEPGLPEAFDELLQPALRRFPEQRYRDAGAFEDALKRTMEATEISAALPVALGELVTSLPARSGTVPPLGPASATETAPSTERRELPAPSTDADTVSPGVTKRRRGLWFTAVGGAALALAGMLLWHWQTSSPPPDASTGPARSDSTKTRATVQPQPAAVGPAHLVTTAVSTTPSSTAAPDATVVRQPPAARPPRKTRPRVATTTRRQAAPSVDARKIARPPRTKREPMVRLVRAPAPDRLESAPVQHEQLALLRRRLSAARGLLRSRGIRPADLSAEMRRGMHDTAQALVRKDAERASATLAALEAGAANVVVDRAFVQRKLSRVGRALRQLPRQSQDVQRLRQRSTQALQAFMDGDFDLANRQLNRILTLLPKKP